jgi:wyosine [tRNA(Phe)-imidazoG37] synthetase (radical SAM superfamily)
MSDSGGKLGVYPLQENVVYGPIRSRRLGRSLGLNLLPTDRKICSYDCVYCHYGRTDLKTLTPAEGEFPHTEDVLKAIRRALHRCGPIDAITFSGNGEPTLHPYFSTIVREVRRLRDRFRPEARLALLSNATTAHLPDVREVLNLFDEPIMKLDAGDARTLARINRPVACISVKQIVQSLAAIPGLVVQSVLIDGEVSNVVGEPFDAWIGALREIGPRYVQIYSTDRPVAEAGVERVPPFRLRAIAEDTARRTGLQIVPYWA